MNPGDLTTGARGFLAINLGPLNLSPLSTIAPARDIAVDPSASRPGHLRSGDLDEAAGAADRGAMRFACAIRDLFVAGKW